MLQVLSRVLAEGLATVYGFLHNGLILPANIWLCVAEIHTLSGMANIF